MPRPKKIVQESLVEETPYVASYAEPENIIEAKMSVIESPVKDEVVVEEEVVIPKQKFKVYHLGEFVQEVEENSNELYDYLEKNRNQLVDNIYKLLEPTANNEDLVLFNIPPTDNRKYNSLAQFYQQNGLAPQPPKITNWMAYYKLKYPLATEEEIAIQVFGPLDYSFDIV